MWSDSQLIALNSELEVLSNLRAITLNIKIYRITLLHVLQSMYAYICIVLL